MDRRAILIEASEVPGQSILKGAKLDPKIFEDFLISKAGGNWYSTEITILRNPTVAEVKSKIAAARIADYSFVSFSGHGYHAKGKSVDETRIMLKNGELSAFELNTGSDRVTVVVDACRNVHLLQRSITANLQLSAIASDMPSTRSLFDQEVQKCERGAIFMYSCDLNEAATEYSNGGLFTNSLVDFAETWSLKQSGSGGKVLSTKDAFAGASIVTTKKMPQQNPQYEPGRRLGHFPFSVWKS